MEEHEIIRASRNIGLISSYLAKHFAGFLIEVNERPPFTVVFNLSHRMSGERLTLDVLWGTLGGRSNTPEFIQARMIDDDLPTRLRHAKKYVWSLGEAPVSEPGRKRNPAN